MMPGERRFWSQLAIGTAIVLIALAIKLARMVYTWFLNNL